MCSTLLIKKFITNKKKKGVHEQQIPTQDYKINRPPEEEDTLRIIQVKHLSNTTVAIL